MLLAWDSRPAVRMAQSYAGKQNAALFITPLASSLCTRLSGCVFSAGARAGFIYWRYLNYFDRIGEGFFWVLKIMQKTAFFLQKRLIFSSDSDIYTNIGL